MKIEKISENQIRCTLTGEDLSDRELKISELAYGTDKAKSLFRDMMQQAAFEFGFEADDIPLMIEAIPLSPDCIILIITKVEDPEELDTRFSRFAPSQSEDEKDTATLPKLEGADEILDLFKKIYDSKAKTVKKPSIKGKPAPELLSVDSNLTRLYQFNNLNSIINVAHVLKPIYTGYNSLYKNEDTSKYFLIISKSEHTPETFNKICNILSEYGTNCKYSPATEAYLSEHTQIIVKSSALQKLSEV